MNQVNRIVETIIQILLRWFDEIMSEKESPSMKALRIVYGDEVIVVQCVPRQVVKGRVLIKVYPDCFGLWPLYRQKHRSTRYCLR